MKKLFLNLIKFYQKITIFSKRSCKFYPTCSQYAEEAIDKYGSFKGSILSIKRILRCTPWATPKVDPLK